MNADNLQPPQFAQRIIEKYVSAQSNTFLVYGNTKDIYPVSKDRYLTLVDFFVEALIRPNKEGAPRMVLVYDPAGGISFLNPLDKSLIGREIGEERLERALSSARADIATALAALARIHPLERDGPPRRRSGQEDPQRSCRHHTLRRSCRTSIQRGCNAGL